MQRKLTGLPGHRLGTMVFSFVASFNPGWGSRNELLFTITPHSERQSYFLQSHRKWHGEAPPSKWPLGKCTLVHSGYWRKNFQLLGRPAPWLAPVRWFRAVPSSKSLSQNNVLPRRSPHEAHISRVRHTTRSHQVSLMTHLTRELRHLKPCAH